MNMVVRTPDGRVLGASSMTRPRGETYPASQRDYPMTTDDFEIPGNPPRRMDRGHVVEHADTLEGSGVRTSTSDPANYVPEPEWWNRRVRSPLVGRIRRRGGGYREINVYDPDPPRTRNGTPVPRGKYFIETDAQGNPVNAWYIDFGYDYRSGPSGLAALEATGPRAPRRISDLSELPSTVVHQD